MEMNLLDFISLEDLQKIQDSFALATGVGACIHEPDGTPITEPSNWCEFCVNYNRKSKIGSERCKASDKLLGAKAINSGKPAIGYCGNGHLIDAAAPIFVEDKNVAIVTCGQVLYGKPNLEDYRKIARGLNVDEDGYIEALKKVTIMPKERFEGVVNLMYQLATVISGLGFQRVKEKRAKEDVEITLSTFRTILSKVTEGDLSSRIDLSSISEKYHTIGENINTTIESIQKHRSELEESRTRYYELVEGVNSIVLRMDTEGTITFINRFAEEFFGYTRDEILGQNIVGTFVPEIESNGRDLKEMILEIGRNPERYKTNVNENIRKNGERVWVSWTNKPVFDEQGRVIEVMCIGNDISELKRMEEELKESRTYFQHLFNSSPVPLTLIGLDGKRLDCNPAMEELTGRNKEGLVNVPVEAAYPKEEHPSVRKKLFDETIEKGYMHGFETYFLRPDGTKLPIVANTALIRDRNGKPLSIIYSATDISELKRREEELKKASEIFGKVLTKASEGDLSVRVDLKELGAGYRAIGENTNKMLAEAKKRMEELKARYKELESFAYIISHDLKTPLVTINGVANMLQRDMKENNAEKVRANLQMIEDTTIKMNELLSDTLKISSIGRIINPPVDVPFGELVQDALEQTEGEIKQNNIEVSVAEDFPTVHVDRMRIVEILVNLISNSIKFMGDQPQPKIEIGHHLDTGETVFFVRDNGIGIAPDQHEKVFEIFYKIDKKSEGTGAGLAIVKQIIEVHGGRTWIESDGTKGKGCTICFTLPGKIVR